MGLNPMVVFGGRPCGCAPSRSARAEGGSLIDRVPWQLCAKRLHASSFLSLDGDNLSWPGRIRW